MKRIRLAINIAGNDLRIFLKDRGNLIGLILVPVLLTIVIGVFFPGGGGRSDAVVVDVIDQDGSPKSEVLLQALKRANSSLYLCPIDNGEEDRCNLNGESEITLQESLDRIERSNTLAVIVIPPGYQKAAEDGEQFEIRYLADPDFSAPIYIQQALQTALQEVNGSLAASNFSQVAGQRLPGLLSGTQMEDLRKDVYDRAVNLWATIPIRVDFQLTGQTETQENGAPPGFSQSVPGMATMYVMGTVFAGMVALIEERKRWILQRLAMMPVPGSSLMGGKIIGRFILGIVQFLVVFAVGVVVGMNFGNSPLALVLIMVSYTLAMTAVSFALGARIDSEEQASGLAQLLVLVLAALGGAWWPLEITPKALQIIGHLSPVAWAMDGFHDLFLRDGSLTNVLPEILVLLGITVVFFFIGLRRIRFL
jgi:linearmycin/streptolysin S transport system permease protein